MLRPRAAQLVGDLVTLSIDQDRFIVNVKGNADSVTVPFDKEELQDLKCEKSSTFPIQFDLLGSFEQNFRKSRVSHSFIW